MSDVLICSQIMENNFRHQIYFFLRMTHSYHLYNVVYLSTIYIIQKKAIVETINLLIQILLLYVNTNATLLLRPQCLREWINTPFISLYVVNRIYRKVASHMKSFQKLASSLKFFVSYVKKINSRYNGMFYTTCYFYRYFLF